MKHFLKWLGFGIAGLISIAALAALTAYVITEREIHRQYDFPLSKFTVTSDADAIKHGERLATIAGCANSCHGKHMEGERMFDEPGIARFNAPNLTRVIHEYNDAELERLMRHGVKRDGTSTWLMPAPMFAHLSDQDLNDIIAFVRSAPLRDGSMRDVTIRPLGRLGMLLGKFKPHVKEINHHEARVAFTDRSDPLHYGEYLVKTSCTECHGQDLRGMELTHAPDLAIIAAYSEADFFHLMRTGRGLGDRKMTLMTEVGESRFPAFTDDEVKAIRLFLNTRITGNMEKTAATSQHSSAS